MTFAPRVGYARAGHRVVETSHGLIFVSEDREQPAMRLRSPDTKLMIQNGGAVADFRLEGGQAASLILEEAEEGGASPAELPDFVSAAFKETANYWTQWISRSTYRGRWQEMVHRSALILKLMTSHEFGSVVASPTFGLPEPSAEPAIGTIATPGSEMHRSLSMPSFVWASWMKHAPT
jgi:GH15 family glucan-1,4-alpha-glucosidase